MDIRCGKHNGLHFDQEYYLLSFGDRKDSFLPGNVSYQLLRAQEPVMTSYLPTLFLLVLLLFVSSATASLQPYSLTSFGLAIKSTPNVPFMKLSTIQYKATTGELWLIQFPIFLTGFNGVFDLQFNCTAISNTGQGTSSSTKTMAVGPFVKQLSVIYPANEYLYFTLSCSYYSLLPSGTIFNLAMTQTPYSTYSGYSNQNLETLIESTMVVAEYYNEGAN